MKTICCGQCKKFLYEDINGYGICGNEEQKEVYERQYPIISEKLECRRDMLLPTILKALESVTEISGKWSVDFIM